MQRLSMTSHYAKNPSIKYQEYQGHIYSLFCLYTRVRDHLMNVDHHVINEETVTTKCTAKQTKNPSPQQFLRNIDNKPQQIILNWAD